MLSADRNQTDIPLVLAVNKNGGVTGLVVVAEIYEAISGDQLDFSDNLFKAPGVPATPTTPIAELDATNAPGLYRSASGFDLASTDFAANEEFVVVKYTYSGGKAGTTAETILISENAFDPAPAGDVSAILADTASMQPLVSANLNAQVALIETAAEAIARQAVLVAEHDQTQADLVAQTTALQGVGGPTLVALAGGGFVSGTDGLQAARVARDLIQTDIDNFENITRFKVSIPILERPEVGTTLHEIYFNLKDDQGLPVNADAGVTVQATSFGGAAGDRDGRLSATSMINLGPGRYLVTFSVAASDVLEGLHFFLSWAEGGNTNNVDKSTHVVDSNEVGYLAADRSRDNQVALETAAVDGRLPVGPADEALQQAAHTATQALVTSLENLSSADIQSALTAQGYTAARAPNLDNLNAPVSGVPAATAVLLNDVSTGDVQTAAQAALTAQGYTSARALLLDNLDELVSAAKTLTLAERQAIASEILGTDQNSNNTTGSVGGSLAAAAAFAGKDVVDDLYVFVGAPPGQPRTFRRRQFATAAAAIAARAAPNAADDADGEIKRWRAQADYTGVTATDTLIAMHFVEEL